MCTYMAQTFDPPACTSQILGLQVSFHLSPLLSLSL